ncbi:hypothetical protein ACQKWADRAFT_307144 [Trichoderma austrokoningii]
MAGIPTQIRHWISEEEVLLAPSLAKSGSQRLYDIVDGEPHVFLFNIRLSNGRAASVEFHITPIVHDCALHVLYTVTGSYTTSHNDVHANEVIGAAQLVYDTYIRVTWLRLDENILKHRAEAPSLSYLSSNILPSNISSGTVARTAGDPMPLENGENHICVSKEAISNSGVPVGNQEVIRTVNTASTLENTKPVKGLGPRTKLDTIAAKISRKIQTYYDNLDGMRALNVDHAVSHCFCPREYNQSFNSHLDQIEEKLVSAMNNSYDKTMVWLNWFFYSCLRLVRDRRRSGRRHMPSTGAKLANLIVDRLLISDGLEALGVYNALAELCYKLRRASELSFQDIEYVSSLVAENLHGRIHISSTSSEVPLPMVWLSTLFPTVP